MSEKPNPYDLEAVHRASRSSAQVSGRGTGGEALTDEVLDEAAYAHEREDRRAYEEDTPFDSETIRRKRCAAMRAVLLSALGAASRAAVTPRDAGDMEKAEADQCGSPQHEGFSYECTRRRGHTGDHVAHGVDGRFLASWPAFPVVLPASAGAGHEENEK